MTDVVLIYPKTGFDLGAGIAPPFSVLSVAAELDSDFDIKIIDQRTEENWENELRKYLKQHLICVGISSMTGNQLNNALSIAKIIREETQTPIVWGGVHASLLPKQTLESRYVDYVVIGEGEKTFYELVDFLKNKPKNKTLKDIKGVAFFDKNRNYVQTEPREFMDPNGFKDTPWHLVDVEKYIHSNVVVKGSKRELDIGETSRGCPFRCGFCYNVMFHKFRWRAMSVEKSVEKIKRHVKKFNLDAVWLRDDNYFANPKRSIEISKRLIADGIKIKWYSSGIRIDLFEKLSDEEIKILVDSGCESFRFGAESGNNRVLKLINKNITSEQIFSANERCRRLGIVPYYSFVIGFPTETMAEVNDTLNMIAKLRKDNPDAKMYAVSLFTPYPGGELSDMLVKMGLKTPDSLEGWAEWHPMQTDFAIHLSDKERTILRNIADVSYYTSEPMIDSLPGAMQKLFAPAKLWFDIRTKIKSFRFMPEVLLLRRIRNNLFMKDKHRYIRIKT